MKIEFFYFGDEHTWSLLPTLQSWRNDFRELNMGDNYAIVIQLQKRFQIPKKDIKMKDTKEQAYKEFIADLRNIENNILSTVDKNQYIKLGEFYNMVGIDDSELSELLKSSGFNTLMEFFNSKEQLKQEDSARINFFISTIKGINNAIERRLLSELQQNP